MKTRILISLIVSILTTIVCPAATMKALIIDGQNNHDWKATTPVLKKTLENSGLFTVDVATSPGKGQSMTAFKPNFATYTVVVSNYNGEPWSKETEDAFVQYVKSGGGFVSVHAANNSFPEWKEYNEIIGLGGWGDRTEKAGPYVRFVDGKIVRDSSPGRGGGHGSQHPFVVEVRDSHHPITAGLPEKWMHAKDELYDRLRGPAENLTLLATAFATKETNGSGHHEPMLMTISYGKGRVFHTTLGHSVEAMKCVGFITTLQRGAEWAATGKVTSKLPNDFPTTDKVSSRE
ncbi:MAG: ThuA domain-containing protein [Verrucomicrobia bacterium]|nr:ThuA domain-containing protein [Verrucomicrobiota bacterium]